MSWYERRDKSGAPASGPRLELMNVGFVAMLAFAVLGPFMTFSALPLMGEGSALRQICYLVAFTVIIIAVRPIERWGRLLAVPLLVTIVLGWCWLSVTWAIIPGVAVRRLILLTLVVWAIFIGVRELGFERSILLIRIVLVATLVANYVAVLAYPTIGIHTANEIDEQTLIGDWRGIMTHKNFAGPTCVMALLFFIFDARRVHIALRVAVIAGAAYFLLRSSSKTSFGLGITAVGVGFLFMLYSVRYRYILMIIATVAGSAATVMALIYKNPLLGNFSDPKSFTGRPVIWRALVSFINDHPLLGAGYGSFWYAGPDGPVYRYATGWLTLIATGHNGYLDLASQIGVPATAFAVVAVLIIPLVRLFASPAANNQGGALVASILFFCIGHNFTESSLFDRDSIVDVFLMLAVALGRALVAQPRRRLSRLSPLGKPRPSSVAS